MLLDSAPSGPQHGASQRLAGALLCVLLANVCASLPAGHKCPKYLDCASEKRHFCKPGSTHCGPCLTPLVENQEGRCVKNRHHPHGKVVSYPELDEEIDFMHSVIEKQQVAVSVPHQSRTQDTSFQTDEKSRFEAPETKQRSQGRPLKETLPNATYTSPTLSPPTPQPRATGAVGRAGPITAPVTRNDTLIILIITLCVTVGTVSLVLAAICFVKFQKESRSAQKVDYKGTANPPASTANSSAHTISLGDKTLAQSAQMYHYQHQKQQMISMGKRKPEQKVPDSEATSDEEEVGGDFTVYECPGLAPTGEMEVKNPLFDDSTLYYQGNHK